MPTLRRALVMVLDGVGIGELPDADSFGDAGSHTLGNLARAMEGLYLPALERLGLGRIDELEGLARVRCPQASYGKMAERSASKDSTAGHWEIAGVVVERPFPLYPHGFPPEVIEPFLRATGRGILGNVPASGTEIIAELGEEHVRTGRLIIYTSADSVFQVAAHKEVVPLEELYAACRAARGILQGEHAVARVIARPFVGSPGSFFRTHERRDFSLPPPRPTVVDLLAQARVLTRAVGKTFELFGERGFRDHQRTENNMDGVDQTLRALSEMREGLIFTNLVDFDTKWGHRNDTVGYYRALQEFDSRLPALLEEIGEQDLFVLTADHGCDPTTPSTDHSREYVPLLVYVRGRPAVPLGVRDTFADVGATIAELFGIAGTGVGKSFLGEIV